MQKLIYGSVAIKSDICKTCGFQSFIVRQRFSCCGRFAYGKQTDIRRISQARSNRKRFSPEFIKTLVSKQSGLCFWCGIPFEELEFSRRKLAKKKVHLEHLEPFIFAANECRKNLVAACSICNLIKSDLMFDSIYECRKYIKIQRRKKGYSVGPNRSKLFDLRKAFPEEAENPSVLLPGMSCEKVG